MSLENKPGKLPEACMVGMAEVKIICDSSDVLVALGIGSCVGVCAYDPMRQIAGLAHIVLPACNDVSTSNCPGKYADTAIPYLVEQMKLCGAAEARLRFALVGGAQLFAFGGGPRLEIGARNALAVETALAARNLHVVARDIGGAAGRTVHIFANGKVRVKTLGQGERELTQLGQEL